MPFVWSLFEDGIRKTVAFCSDALLKAMSEVFSCSSAHLRGYYSDFLPNSHLQFFQIVWPASEHFLLEISPQEKSQMLKSGERGGQSTSPLRETRRAGNICHNLTIATWAVWAVAPSCWNQMSPRFVSSLNSSNLGSKKSSNIAR